MQKQCPYCTNMMDANVEYCPHCRAKNIKDFTFEEYSANVKTHSHNGEELCDDADLYRRHYAESYRTSPNVAHNHVGTVRSAQTTSSNSQATAPGSGCAALIVKVSIFMFLLSFISQFVPRVFFMLFMYATDYNISLYNQICGDDPSGMNTLITLLVTAFIYLLIIAPFFRRLKRKQ